MSKITSAVRLAGKLTGCSILVTCFLPVLSVSSGSDKGQSIALATSRIKFIQFVKVDPQQDAFMHLDEHIRVIVSNIDGLEDVNASQWRNFQVPDPKSMKHFTYLLAVDKSSRETRGICFHQGMYEWLPSSRGCGILSSGQMIDSSWKLGGEQVTLKVKAQALPAAAYFFTVK